MGFFFEGRKSLMKNKLTERKKRRKTEIYKYRNKKYQLHKSLFATLT